MPKPAVHQVREPGKAEAGNPEAVTAAEAAADAAPGRTAAGGSPDSEDSETEPEISTPEGSQKNGLRVKSGHRTYVIKDRINAIGGGIWHRAADRIKSISQKQR